MFQEQDQLQPTIRISEDVYLGSLMEYANQTPIIAAILLIEIFIGII
jgi:hypothetical protein